MKEDSLELINNFQTRYSNAISPILFKNFSNELDSILRQIYANEGVITCQVDITINSSNFIDFIIDFSFMNLSITFNKCNADSIIIDKEYGTQLFLECNFTKIDSQNSMGGTTFSRCTAENIKISNRNDLKFHDCKIKNFDFSFRYTDITGVLISNSNFNLLFSGASKDKSVKLNNCNFYGCTFQNIEQKIDFIFGNNVDFFHCIFTRTTSDYEVIYRKFKKDFQEHRHENLSNLFGSLELECHHNTLKIQGPSINYYLSSIYNWLNRFGLDPYRPLFILIKLSLATFLFTLLYSCNFLSALNDTFIFLLGPFKLLTKDLAFEIPNSIISSLLNIISSLLWFFLILAIRKKFKIEK